MDTSKQKPDLMGTSGSQPDGAKRILAHLEHGAKLPASKPARAAARRLDGWTVGLALLVLAMCGIAWLAHERTASGGYKASYGSARAAARSESKYETIRARVESARMPPTEVIVEPAELPAMIVTDDPALALARNRSDTQMTATSRTVAGTSAAPAAQQADVPAPGPATVATAAVRMASFNAPHSRPATAGTKNAAGTDDDIGASTALMASPRAPATVAMQAHAKAAAPVNDTDVALLAALVAHANKPSAVAPERSRDIVERHEGDSTADLLARCKQLGLIEGMLCRSRICSGRWDSDATCRVPAH